MALGVAGNRSRPIYIKVGRSGTIETVDYVVRDVGHDAQACRFSGP